MSTTYNTHCWINEFLNKDELEALWTQRREVKNKSQSYIKQSPIQTKQPTPVKKFTLDLNAAVMKNKFKKIDKISNSCNIKSIREDTTGRGTKRSERSTAGQKKTISSVAYKARDSCDNSKRYNLKVSMNESNRM